MNTPEKPAATLGKFARARGGKELVRFKDVLGNNCTLETSGNGAVPGAFSIRIGAEKAQPRIQAMDARALGMTTTQKTGLINYPIPEEVRITTGVVLSRNQVAEVIELLLRWLRRGTFEDTHGISELLSLEPGLAAPQSAPEKTAEQKRVDQILEDQQKQLARRTTREQAKAQAAVDRRPDEDEKPANDGPTEDELAREEAAEFALNAQLEDDGIPPELREPYQEARRKGQAYHSKRKSEVVE